MIVSNGVLENFVPRPRRSILRKNIWIKEVTKNSYFFIDSVANHLNWIELYAISTRHKNAFDSFYFPLLPAIKLLSEFNRLNLWIVSKPIILIRTHFTWKLSISEHLDDQISGHCCMFEGMLVNLKDKLFMQTIDLTINKTTLENDGQNIPDLTQ
jgi:hypothetical protein